MPAKQIRAGRATIKPSLERLSLIRSLLVSLDKSYPEFHSEPLEVPHLVSLDNTEIKRALNTGESVLISRNALREIIAALGPK